MQTIQTSSIAAETALIPAEEAAALAPSLRMRKEAQFMAVKELNMVRVMRASFNDEDIIKYANRALGNVLGATSLIQDGGGGAGVICAG